MRIRRIRTGLYVWVSGACGVVQPSVVGSGRVGPAGDEPPTSSSCDWSSQCIPILELLRPVYGRRISFSIFSAFIPNAHYD